MADPLAPVVLAVEITIDGRTYAPKMGVPQRDWETIARDPELRASYEDMIRARLGEVAMQQVQPPVTVHMPTEMDEAVTQRVAGEPPDAP